MIIGVPKEIKTEEYRVGITPMGVSQLQKLGHSLIIESDAGLGSGFSNNVYIQAGATIAKSAKDVYQKANLIVKVKEPLESEYEMLNEKQMLFTYLHLAANEKLTKMLLKSGVKAFAYESVEKDGKLPCLEPMSEIAGRMAAVVGANHLARSNGGEGVLICGATGVKRAKVLVLGSGTVGKNAAIISAGMGADVIIAGRKSTKLSEIEKTMPKNVSTIYSNEENIKALLPDIDLVIGAVLIKNQKAPYILSNEMIKSMKKGSVFVDVSIDQGGCAQTSKSTTHSNPTYEKFGVLHYCVANMPGAYPKTSTMSLTENTLPYIILLAQKGFIKTIKEHEDMRKALNTANKKLYNQSIADTFGLNAYDTNELIQ